MAKKPKGAFPDLQEIETEMSMVRSKGRFRQTMKGVAGTVVVIIALGILVATIALPVTRVTGTAMQPGFQPGDIIACVKTNDFKQGDICTFYFNNKMVLMRIIAVGGDIVEMDEEGHVTVNKVPLDESEYLSEYALGQCDIEFPYQVPLNSYFVMGDNRETSVDSRSKNFGCIPGEEMVGRILVRIYPFNTLKYFGM